MGTGPGVGRGAGVSVGVGGSGVGVAVGVFVERGGIVGRGVGVKVGVQVAGKIGVLKAISGFSGVGMARSRIVVMTTTPPIAATTITSTMANIIRIRFCISVTSLPLEQNYLTHVSRVIARQS